MKQEEFDWIQAPKNRKGQIMRRNRNQTQPLVRTPQFPGAEPGMSIEQVREVIRNQKRAKGFSFGLSAGGNNEFSIELSGTARVFLGFALDLLPTGDPNNAPLEMTLVINDEIVIQNVQPSFFGAQFTDDEYFFIPRPLSGQDTITVTFNAPVAFDIVMIAYYI